MNDKFLGALLDNAQTFDCSLTLLLPPVDTRLPTAYLVVNCYVIALDRNDAINTVEWFFLNYFPGFRCIAHTCFHDGTCDDITPRAVELTTIETYFRVVGVEYK